MVRVRQRRNWTETGFIIHYEVCMYLRGQKQLGDMEDHFVIGLMGLSS